ncbi:MAG: dockerin type I repeat-containing protein [Oscillospiraceae bacterium]
MFKKRLKGLLAMVLAGSLATTALPLTASATFADVITIKGGDLDGRTIASGEIGENAFTAGVLHDNTTYLTENNLWAVYSCWADPDSRSGYISVAVSGDELANTLYNYNTDSVKDYYSTQIKYTHDLAFTTMDISDDTLTIESADMINKKADVFPYDISSVISQIEVDPLKEITSWTAWYNRDSGNVRDDYNYAGNCVKINDTPNLITEDISADIVGKVYFADDYRANDAFKYGKTIIQLNTDYREFELPVLNAVCAPEKIDGVQNTITVKHGETTALDGSFYLCHEKVGYNWISDTSASTEDGIWNLIENMKTVLGEKFDPDSLQLLRDTTIYVDGYGVQGYFTSRDLYRFARRIDPSNTNSTIEDLISLYDVCIWKIYGNTDLEAYSDNANLINKLGLELNKYPTTTSVYIDEPTVYVTGIDPATSTTIADSDYFATDIMEPIDEIVARLKQNNPGKQYKTSDWQFWECSLVCGDVGYYANGFRKLTPAATAIEFFNQLGAGKDMLTYFQEVVFAPAVEVTAPIIGEAPSTECTIKDTVGCYTVKSVSWTCGDTQLTSADKFAAGKQYTITVTLKPDTGLEFSADTVVTIKENEAATTLNDDGTLSAFYTFEALPLIDITSAAITVTAPELGKTPAAEATANENANFTVSNVQWNPADAAFKAETEYTVSAKLTAKDGYKFANNTSVTINGNTATVTPNNDGTLTVTYKFAAIQLTEITSANVYVTAPQLGKAPATTADLHDGAHCTASDVQWNPADTTFKADTAYTVSAKLVADLGYKFAGNISVKINDKTATVTPNNDGTLTVSYTFGKLSDGPSAPSPRPDKPGSDRKLAKTEKSVGWSSIIKEMKAADVGSTIKIALNDDTFIPEEALQAAIDRKIKLIMDANFGRVWNIDGAKAVPGDEIDLSVAALEVGIPAAAYKDISYTDGQQLKVNARELNFTAKLTATIGGSNIGKNAAVYLYNEATGKLMFRSITVVDTNGNVTFDVEEGGRYFIAMGSDVKAPDAIRGDVNGDGTVNALDASAILKNVANNKTTDKQVGDTNSDGTVNALDASTILKYVVGNIKDFPNSAA